MLNILRVFIFSFLFISATAWSGQTIEVKTSMEDRFVISETDFWNVKLERSVLLRFADVRIDNKLGYPFSLMLYFKADTPDLALFNTPKKIERAVLKSSEEYFPYIIEKKITLKEIPVAGTYGFYTVLTDKEVAKQTKIPPGEFKYLTRGMFRLSKDSALGFSLMTNDIDSYDYDELLKYVYSFIKWGSVR